MEFGGEDDKDSGVGEWTFQRRPESSALWQLWSPSPAQSAGVAPVSLRRATASRLRTLQNSEGDVKPVSLSILRSIILLLLFSFFVNYKIVLINKYCPRLYLYYPQVFFFFVFCPLLHTQPLCSGPLLKLNKGRMKAILLSQVSSPEWTLVQRADWASPEPVWCPLHMG